MGLYRQLDLQDRGIPRRRAPIDGAPGKQDDPGRDQPGQAGCQRLSRAAPPTPSVRAKHSTDQGSPCSRIASAAATGGGRQHATAAGRPAPPAAKTTTTRQPTTRRTKTTSMGCSTVYRKDCAKNLASSSKAMAMPVWRLSIIGILLIAVAGGGYYFYSNFFHAEIVSTSIAKLAPVSEAVFGTGTVEPQRWAKVVPLQRRRLVELCSCEGQAVKTGQVLGRQDAAEERSELNELEINNAQLQRDLDRAQKDRDKSAQAQAEYEQRWTQFEQSKSRIAAQKVRIDGLVLRAPLDGMVLRRDGEVGEIVRTYRRVVLGWPAGSDAGCRRGQRRRNQPDRPRAKRLSCGARLSRHRRCAPAFHRSRRRAIRPARPSVSICCCQTTRRSRSGCRSKSTSSSAKSRPRSLCRPKPLQAMRFRWWTTAGFSACRCRSAFAAAAMSKSSAGCCEEWRCSRPPAPILPMAPGFASRTA